MQASSEHEFLPGSCWACAGEVPIAANPANESTAMSAEIRSMENPSVIGYRRYWMSALLDVGDKIMRRLKQWFRLPALPSETHVSRDFKAANRYEGRNRAARQCGDGAQIRMQRHFSRPSPGRHS
jgi:hypothetical protein